MFSGHDRSNDDMLAPNAGGYAYRTDGSGEERGVWGGRDAKFQGYETDANGKIDYSKDVWSPSARELDVNRYRQMGADQASRPTYQLNYGDANRSLGAATQATGQAYDDRRHAEGARTQQVQALGLQQQAAMGSVPSRAELLGRGLLDQGLQNQVAGAASARGGPLAQMAAGRNVQQGAAAFQQQGMNQLSALRADEMERARAGYSSAATGLRTSDYAGADQAVRLGDGFGRIATTQAGMADAQGRVEMGQRELNQRGELGYERLGWDTNNAAANIGLGRSGLEAGAYQFGQQMEQQDEDQARAWAGAALGAGGALTGGVMNYAGQQKMADAYKGGQSQGSGGSGGGIIRENPYSDMRAKTPAPLLLATGKQPKAANPNWLDNVMSPERAQMRSRIQQDEHEDRLDQVDGDLISRDNPYAPPTPGDIQREDPYGSGEMFYSDEHAKRAAFAEGLTYGQGELYGASKGQANPEKLPAYMQPKQRTPTPSGEGRTLGVQGPKTATEIDPKARGERPEPPNEVGTRATEGGYPRAQPQGIPHSKDLTGQKPSPGGPLSSIQQDANRRGAGFPYAYKDEYRPGSQEPGEVNFGFSAQELEKNPITATAVKQDPNGMRFIDTDKLLKTNTAGIASLQNQIDQLQYGGRRG